MSGVMISGISRRPESPCRISVTAISGIAISLISAQISQTSSSNIQRSNANLIAFLILSTLSFGKVVIKDPIFDCETVCMWSQLITQSLCIPSCRVRSTSLGISRIVEVIGATVTSPKYSKTEFLVKITMGRFLSGCLNLYHRTSPRFINHPILAPIPRH